MKSLVFIVALCLALTTPLAALLAAAPRPSGPVLVIVPPWQNAGDIIRAAGGLEIGPETAPFAALGQSDDPGFAQRLMAAGSWSVVDGTQIAQFCGAL